MSTATTKPPLITGLGGAVSIWLAILIFAAANSIVQLLNQLGTMHPIDGRNPISFCNVLFVGNLFAFFALAIIYRKQLTRENFSQLKWSDWLALVVMASTTSSLAPALVFLALERTSIINVVMLGRLEPILFILLATLVLGLRPDRWNIMSLILTFIGVAVTMSWQAMGDYSQFGTGEIMVIAASCISAMSSIISKIWLKRIPIGIFVVFRTGLGAIIFFWFAVYLFGFSHFQDVISPFLWKWMLVYVAIVVVGGQLLWLTGLKSSRADTVAMVGIFSPIAGVFFAVLLLNTTPTLPILIGCSFFFAGFVLMGYGVWNQRQKHKQVSATAPTDTLAIEAGSVFKGV